MRASLSLECVPIRDLHLQAASDAEIFHAARAARVVVMSKDGDFVDLLDQHGAPPQVVLVTCGNTSNARPRRLIGHPGRRFSLCLSAVSPSSSSGINRTRLHKGLADPNLALFLPFGRHNGRPIAANSGKPFSRLETVFIRITPLSATPGQSGKAQQMASISAVNRRVAGSNPARPRFCPGLPLFGELDNNLLPDKNRAISEAALKAGGNHDYTLVILPNANHFSSKRSLEATRKWLRCNGSFRPISQALKAGSPNGFQLRRLCTRGNGGLPSICPPALTLQWKVKREKGKDKTRGN